MYSPFFCFVCQKIGIFFSQKISKKNQKKAKENSNKTHRHREILSRAFLQLQRLLRIEDNQKIDRLFLLDNAIQRIEDLRNAINQIELQQAMGDNTNFQPFQPQLYNSN